MISLNLSIFRVKNFYYVINCLYLNRVTIYRAKCLGKVNLKVLPTTCFRFNSEEISSNFLIPKMRLNRIALQCKFDKKMFKGFWEKDRFLQIFLSIFLEKFTHIHFNPSQYFSPILLLNGLVMVTNERSIACKCFEKGNVRDIRSNIAYFVHIWKFNLFFISKLKFDRVYAKCLAILIWRSY